MGGSGGTDSDDNAAAELRRWLWVALAIAAAGLTMAILADAPWFEVPSGDSNFNDAWREIGGAMFAGALIASIVVWFEQRREEDRIDREEARERRLQQLDDHRADLAAVRAWRRDIDIQLVRILDGEFQRVRYDWRDAVIMSAEREQAQEAARRRGDPLHGLLGIGVDNHLLTPRPGRNISEVKDDVRALLTFLRDEHLSLAWEAWDEASRQFAQFPLATSLQDDEEARIVELFETLRTYIDTWYPNGPLSKTLGPEPRGYE